MSEQLNLFDELSFYEGVDLEYKAAKGGLPRDLWETYSAFANTDGGTIWLGITQRGAQLDLHGVADPEKLLADFWNTVNNRGKASANLLRERDARIVRLEDPERALIRIDVPRADRHQRPVFIGPDPMRGTYRRNFEGDYRCSEAEVRRMFADQSDEPADSRILDGFSWDDLHPESLRQFRNRAASSRLGQAWLTEDDEGLLRKLGGWRRDRSSGRAGLTVAGLLMFGRNEAIRDPSAVPGFHLDYRERFSDDPRVRWTDRLTPDGTWEGNVFQFYQQVMLKLSSGPGIKRPFQTDSEGYRLGGSPVGEALQEALVNALIHADYAGQGGILIDRHVDRIVFSNPGSLLVSREQLMQGGVSECRNKSLQQMFQVLGTGDKAGSGIDKIRSSWLAQHWQSPGLRETHRPDRVELYLPMISTLPEGALDTLRGYFGERLDGLGADEIQALVTAQVEGAVTNQRLQEMLTRHRVDITKMLQGMVRQGFFEAEGAGRGTRYALPTGVPGRSTVGGTPPVSDGTPPVSDGTPPVSDGTSPVSGEAISPPLKPDAIVRRIRESKRARPEQMRQAIQALCASDFLTAQQIADWLGRSKKRLQDEFLGPMCAAGILVMRYPETPNHKQQAYRSASAVESQGAAS